MLAEENFSSYPPFQENNGPSISFGDRFPAYFVPNSNISIHLTTRIEIITKH